jgi:hypothetical protein
MEGLEVEDLQFPVSLLRIDNDDHSLKDSIAVNV